MGEIRVLHGANRASDTNYRSSYRWSTGEGLHAGDATELHTIAEPATLGPLGDLSGSDVRRQYRDEEGSEQSGRMHLLQQSRGRWHMPPRRKVSIYRSTLAWQVRHDLGSPFATCSGCGPEGRQVGVDIPVKTRTLKADQHWCVGHG